MNTYEVEVPIVGFVSLEIEAETEAEAKEKALETEWTDDDVIELNSVDWITQGNVVNVPRNEVRAKLIEGDD